MGSYRFRGVASVIVAFVSCAALFWACNSALAASSDQGEKLSGASKSSPNLTKIAQKKKKGRWQKYKSSAPPIPHVFRPRGSGPFPGVILLHTNGGVKSHIVTFGRKLAAKGYVALVVDYFTRGGIDNIELGYDRLAKDKRVDPGRIGVVGFSKGGDQGIKFIAYSHNFTDRRIGAMVSHYIGPVIPSSDKAHPPMLFLHESIVTSVVTPEAVESYCKHQSELGTVCEAHIYEGVHHGWDTNCSYCKYNAAATRDSFDRTVKFLDVHLKDAPQPAQAGKGP